MLMSSQLSRVITLFSFVAEFYDKIAASYAMKNQELKKIAEKYSSEQLEACIRQQLDKGENACELVDGSDDVITELSKAEVVRELMEQGMKFSDALRELGRRIRAVYGKEEEHHGQ
jgi:cell fate (sporulation/competence/biofilm development) regulator YmcA (YheA/YmcA/DUF963 family)